MALVVGMLAADLAAGHAEHHEIPFRNKGHLAVELAHRQAAAQVGDHREVVNRDALHSRLFEPGAAARAAMLGRRAGAGGRVDVANDVGGVAFDDGARRHRPRDDRAGPHDGFRTDHHAGQDAGVGTDPGASLHHRRRLAATGCTGKSRMGTDVHLVLDHRATADVGTALDHAVFADHGLRVDEGMRAQRGAAADGRARVDHAVALALCAGGGVDQRFALGVGHQAHVASSFLYVV